LKYSEYPSDWNPVTDHRISAWKGLYHLVKAFQESEAKAGVLLSAMRSQADAIRQLAYRLYTFCERKGWAEDARVVNELVSSWHGVIQASERPDRPLRQHKLKGFSDQPEDE
jgi:putative DNA methylase